MKKKFELPDKWYLKVTENNLGIINDWRINIVKYSSGEIDFTHFPLIDQDGQGIVNNKKDLKVITFNQFKRYVLKKPKEDYKYLLKLFKELDLK